MSQALLDAINQITPESSAEQKQLADQYLTVDDVRIRLACLQAITRLGYTTRYDDVNYLRSDPSKWIRVQVLRALIAIGEDDEESIASDLTMYFGDSEPIVRLEAIYTMYHYNLQPYVPISDDLALLWDDTSRVWESRGEQINQLMHGLFGKYDPTQFKQVSYDFPEDEPLANDDEIVATASEDFVQSNTTEEEEADAIFSLDALEDFMVEEGLDDSAEVVPHKAMDLGLLDTDTDEALPDWLSDLDEDDDDVPTHEFEDVPEWLLGDVDISPDDFAEMVEEFEDESDDTDDVSPDNEIPDWLRAGSDQDTGQIELDIFDDDN
ncbi:MAG: hypothetical protein AAF846_09170 [Chloroflexota bacterium]